MSKKIFGGGSKKKKAVDQPALESSKWTPIVSQLSASDPNLLRILNKGGGRSSSPGPSPGGSVLGGGGYLGSGGSLGGGLLRRRGGY